MGNDGSMLEVIISFSDNVIGIDHFRITAIWPGDRIRRPDPNTQLKTRLDAAVAMRVYSRSAGRTLH